MRSRRTFALLIESVHLHLLLSHNPHGFSDLSINMVPSDTYGRPVCDAEDATFRTCFAMLRARFAHVSQLSHWAFRMFRTCFAMFRTRFATFTLGISHVSHMFRTCFATFTLGISHISRMLRGTSHIFRRLHTSHHTYFTIGVRPADTQEHNVCRGPLSPGLDVLDVRLDASSMQDRRMASAQPRHLDTSSTLTPVTPPRG